jgi:hypothetical protein
MWPTLAMATVLTLAPAQSGTLQLKNDRFTYGELGQERKNAQVLPGDELVIAFDIVGLKLADDGRVQYSMLLDLQNKDGKSQFKQEPSDMVAFNALGGDRVPGIAKVTVGLETPPGEYTAKVTVTDRSTGKSESLTKKFEVLPVRFGLVRVSFLHNFPGMSVFPPAPPIAVPGQTYLVFFALVGFDLDKARKDQPSIETSLRVVDEDGKSTLAKPFVGQVNEVAPEAKKALPLQFTVSLNRPGKFKLEVKATDKVSGKTAEQTLDLTVVEPK